MAELQDIRGELELFKEAMFAKMMKRAEEFHRTMFPWHFATWKLQDRLEEEFEEWKAERTSQHGDYSKQTETEIDELLDIANFCFFLYARFRLMQMSTPKRKEVA